MDDAKIVQLYWDRNEQAIPATADKYGRYCTSIANNILGNNEDAKECVNDTYLNAWNSMPPHRPSILSTFLGKIVRNLSFNRYKHNTADKRGGGELPVVLRNFQTWYLARMMLGRHLTKRNSRKPLIHFWIVFLQRKEVFLSADTGTPIAFQKLLSGTA